MTVGSISFVGRQMTTLLLVLLFAVGSLLMTPQSSAEAQEKFGRLTPATFAQLEDYVQLDLLRMRLAPSALANEGLFKYFALLNNCGAGSEFVARNMNNEFEYPAIKAYYTDNAAAILNALPLEIVRTESPANLLRLSPYSLERRAFTFVKAYGQELTPERLEIPSWSTSTVSRHFLCPTGRMIGLHGPFPTYVVTRDALSFTAFAVDEQVARQFVEKSKRREFALRITSQILPQAPRAANRGGFMVYEFSSVVTRVDVLTPATNVPGEVVGTLYVGK